MFIKDSYLLAASHTFELKDMQEVTVNIALNKVPPCYYTLLTGRVLHRRKPIKGAVVKIFDCKYNPLFHAVTNSRGMYQFHNVLPPGKYKVVAAADGYQTSRVRRIKLKKKRVVKESFHLRRCPLYMGGVIYGKVREVKSRESIEGATVYLRDERGLIYKTTSNKEGQYIIYSIRPNKYKLTVKKHGYVTSKSLEFTVNKNDRIMLPVDLKECNYSADSRNS
jgi:uncharacterized surface anchored protein